MGELHTDLRALSMAEADNALQRWNLTVGPETGVFGRDSTSEDKIRKEDPEHGHGKLYTPSGTTAVASWQIAPAPLAAIDCSKNLGFTLHVDLLIIWTYANVDKMPVGRMSIIRTVHAHGSLERYNCKLNKARNITP